ncbi:hypothetical protein SARC_11522 [Sphaeroforma arctica JP610]|uniref:Uncharacterized protein n=1 Tax=Sphaeroforma arctica JP610 TaxID=667725 RepID=A0A0L0FGR0_9EUKA|nr:hypothetical protein SARC_11522 [Sphaeroforma arctica JP610]KNC75962.1 hypothetical protein SARC_11522 [Sphaeroforma arctica JP610]|eukprot:XP_014149864.1 hypothetical protein SARC_11522 [Sphaeroforma arctica JP610]
MSPEKRMDLSAKPVAADPNGLSVSIPYEDLSPEVQANHSPVLSPGHESPVLEGIIDPEAEDFHSDEVTELNKAVDVCTKQMKFAHTDHRTDDVSYYSNIIAIKQKRIDQLPQAQRGQDHRDNQKYK